MYKDILGLSTKCKENWDNKNYGFPNIILCTKTTFINFRCTLLLGGHVLLLFGRPLLFHLGVRRFIILGKVILQIIRGVRLLLPDRLLVIFLSIYCGYFSASPLLLLEDMNSSDDKYSGD